MILAGIDIGTSTLRLLVAEIGPDSFQEIYADRRITRLGQDLDRTGRLSSNARERSLNALLDFSASIRRHGALPASAVGTSALRNASNAAEFIADIQQRTGLAVRVISGEEEARFTLLGVARALTGLDSNHAKDSPLASALVIDVGGGSTELIMTKPDRKPLVASLPLGAVYLTERFIKHDPPMADELGLLRSTIRETFEQQAVGMRGTAGIFVGTAGTITTLAAMDQGLTLYDPDKVNGYLMTKETIEGIVGKLVVSTLAERRTFPGLEQGREDIILAGAVVTQELMSWSGFSTMVVSDWGLREGLVLDLYERMNKNA
jgi:exopolyphosphatase/guanosine-5'-triphosphate,3'-diphosphate pyrophosphatase